MTAPTQLSPSTVIPADSTEPASTEGDGGTDAAIGTTRATASTRPASATESGGGAASHATTAPRNPGERLAIDARSFETTTHLGVLPWVDPDRAGRAEDPRSAYVETFWLPVLGPTTTLLLRRLADELDASPDGFEIDCAALSREIGLSTRMNNRSPFVRAIDRCVKFNHAQLVDGILYVRRAIPRLRPRQVKRLSERLQALHASWTVPDDGAQRRIELLRATHLARTLLALDGTSHDVERQLHRWHFHPSIASHAVRWAQADPELDVCG